MTMPFAGAAGTLRQADSLRTFDADGESFRDVVGRIQGSIDSVVVGKSESVRLALVVLLAEGHLLIEDVPGVGKTLLAKA
ncbi:MAG TPA: hypothetical protein VHV82_21245, partial [Sporichthyaceae bacterium]|nr:hypothetical protein [Sporichthyaceae bacterium]